MIPTYICPQSHVGGLVAGAGKGLTMDYQQQSQWQMGRTTGAEAASLALESKQQASGTERRCSVLVFVLIACGMLSPAFLPSSCDTIYKSVAFSQFSNNFSTLPKWHGRALLCFAHRCALFISF